MSNKLLIPLLISGGLYFYLRKYQYTAAKNIATTKEASDLIETMSTIDSKSYYVLKSSNTKDAANLIAKLHASVQKIITHIEQMDIDDLSYDIQQGIQALTSKHPHGTNIDLYELNPNQSDALAYNRNKSSIFLCLRKDPAVSDKLANHDTVLFVVLHELAHTMQTKFASSIQGKTVHDENFRRLERFLMSISEKLSLLHPKSVPGRTHCGQLMPNPDHSM